MAEYPGVIIRDPWSLREYLKARGSGGFHVSYRDDGESRNVKPGDVFHMLQALRNVTLFWEEASKWLNTKNTSLDQVLWFLQYGRHHSISNVLVARRPSELDRMATAQADVIISFRQHEPRDLEYIRAIGGQAAADEVAGLGPFEWAYVMKEHAELVALLDSVSEETGGNDDDGVGATDSGEAGDGIGGAGARDPESAVGEGEPSNRAGAESGGSPGVVRKPGGDGSGDGDSGEPESPGGAPGKGRKGRSGRRKAARVSKEGEDPLTALDGS